MKVRKSEKSLVVGLDVGTSKIVAIVGESQPDGTVEVIAGAGDEPIEEALNYFSLIGPAARVAAEMDEAARGRFFDRIRELASRNCHEGIVSLPAAAWVVSATKVA